VLQAALEADAREVRRVPSDLAEDEHEGHGLRRQVGEDFRLLEDIGWNGRDPRS